MNNMRTLLRKELLEILRDKKALFTTILMPLLSMPAMGVVMILLGSQQPVVIAIVDSDGASVCSDYACYSSRWLVGNITAGVRQRGWAVEEVDSLEVALSKRIYDIIVHIPKGFTSNASGIGSQGAVEIVRRVNIQVAQQAESVIRGIIAYQSQILSKLKIDNLVAKAGIEPSDATYWSLVDPIVAGATIIVSPTGSEVSSLEEAKGLLARFLVLGFSFIVAPATGFVIEGIIGERERKTIEMLVSSSAGVREIIYSKMIGATLIGLIAAFSDIGGLLAYLFALIASLGGNVLLILDPVLIALHAGVSFLTILTTVALTTPFVAKTRSIRGASNIASIITSIGVIFYFSGWMVDFVKLPTFIQLALMIAPFTHSIVAVQGYVAGEHMRAALSVVLLIIYTTVFTGIAVKTVKRENLLIAE